MNKYCVVGYHGTTQARATHILAGEPFRKSNKKTEWLGEGVYFFPYLSHAKWWTTHERFAKEKTAILKADLVFADEEMLDLDDPARRRELEDTVNAFLQASTRDEKPSRTVTEREFQCLACNIFRELHNGIGITKYTFPVNQKRSNSPFPENQCQICVSKSSIITNITKVEEL